MISWEQQKRDAQRMDDRNWGEQLMVDSNWGEQQIDKVKSRYGT